MPSEDIRKRQVTFKNLPPNTTWQNLKDFLSAGDVKGIERVDVNGRGANAYGTVLFDNNENAKEAYLSFHNYNWEGKTLSVSMSDFEETAKFTSLYVGNIPFNVGWQDLKDIFRTTNGEVIRADILKDYQGKSKGFGIVQMGSAEDAKKAIEELNGFELDGRKLEVREDRNSQQHQNNEACQLYVGNLPYDEKWQTLKDHFSEAGNVVRVEIISDASGRSRGFGTVIMSTPEEAQKAIELFNETNYNGRDIQVKLDKFANEHQSRNNYRGNYRNNGYNNNRGGYNNRNSGYNNNRRGYRGGRGGYNNSRSPQRRNDIEIIVGNLPFSTRWKELKEFVEGLDLKPSFVDVVLEGSRPKGYGTVKFNTTEEAEDAISKINDYEYQGRKLFARFEN